MRTLNTRSKVVAISLLIAMVASAAFANQSVKTESSRSGCISLFIREQSRLITEGCNSPVGFCAGGAFKGNHGFKGTSFFSAISFDPIQNDPQGRQVVPGVSTYTSDDGSITISDVSVFDTARGTFSGIGRIVQGTGRFAGATGDVFTAGRALPDGSFTNELNGEICLPN
jgi:hypothetical protein